MSKQIESQQNESYSDFFESTRHELMDVSFSATVKDIEKMIILEIENSDDNELTTFINCFLKYNFFPLNSARVAVEIDLMLSKN